MSSVFVVGDHPVDVLRLHFSQFGVVSEVDAKVGFAFVKFASAEQATKALSMDEHVINGRRVAVKQAHNKAPSVAAANEVVFPGVRNNVCECGERLSRVADGALARHRESKRHVTFVDQQRVSLTKQMAQLRAPPPTALVRELSCEVATLFERIGPTARACEQRER